MPTSFENFVNTELPKRIGTNEHPATVVAGRVPVYTGVGLLTEAQAVEDIVPSEVLWYPDLASFPVEGELEKLYVAEDTDTVYRWKGLAYAIVGSPLLNADAVAETEGRVFLSPEQKTVATQAASSSQSGYLTSADWSTFNGKQNALSDVITADTYGSSTQYPVITFNTKGIATGVTLQTVSVAEVSDNVFRIKDNDDATKKIAFEASGIAADQTRTINMPDFDVDLNKAVYRKDLSMSVALSSLRAGDEIDLTVSTTTVSMQHSDTFSTVKGYYFNNNTQSAVTFTLSRSLGTASPTILTNIDGVTGETLSSQDFNVTTTAFNHIVYIPRYGRLLISPGSSGQVRLVVYSPQGNSISANNSLWCESTTLAGFHNTAIKCKDLKIHANQKFGRFEDLWGFPLTSQLPGATSPANGILVPIGTKMRGFKGNSVVGSTSGCRVEAVFTRTVVGATGSVVTMSDSDGITPYSHMASWSGGDPITEHYITLRSGNAYLLILYTVGPNGGSGVTVGSTTLHSVGTLPAVSVSISGGRLTASFTVPSQAYYTYEIRSVYGVDL